MVIERSKYALQKGVAIGKQFLDVTTTIVSLLATALIWSQLIRIYYRAFSERSAFRQQMLDQLQLSLMLMILIMLALALWQEYRTLDESDNMEFKSDKTDIIKMTEVYQLSVDEISQIQNMPLVHLTKEKFEDARGASVEIILITDDHHKVQIYAEPLNA